MTKQNLTTGALLAGLCLGVPTAVLAATPGTQPPANSKPALSPTEQFLQDIKNPTPWLTWGADIRARNEFQDNTVTLDSDNDLARQDYFRFRARLWTSIKPFEGFSLNARLATEPREWMRPAGFSPHRGRSGLDWTEGIIDNLNIQWREIGHQPVSIIVGRQDIMLGEGWLTGDGTPHDGSWTYFLDAARITYELKDQKTVIDAIGIIQSAKDDSWLQPINNQNRYFSENHEKGAILNVLNTSIDKFGINPYFIYKTDDDVNDDTATGVNSDIFTFGSRLFGNITEHWKYSVEGAYQFGQKEDVLIRFPEQSDDERDIRAFGVNTKLGYAFKDKLNNQVGLNYEFLSGDDPDTKQDEMFDAMWGRYPRWSEIGLYSTARETRIGMMANYHRFGPTWTCNPMKGMEFTTSYYALFADQQVATRGAVGRFTNDDIFRGHFISAVLKHKFSNHLAGHLWGEMLLPGNYYVMDRPMTFLRAELLFTF